MSEICRYLCPPGKEILFQVIRDAVQQHKEESSFEKSRHSLVATADSLGMTESGVESDLLSIFVAGFHTTASRAASIQILSMHCVH